MLKRRSLKRWIALVVLAAATFAQASVSVLACQMERGALSHAVQASEPCPCDEAQSGCESSQLTNLCVAHCTSDLQLAGAAVALVRAPADAPAFFFPRTELRVPGRAIAEGAPPVSVPIRILLQSLQI